MLPEIVYITQLDTGTRIALPLTPEKVSDKREGNFISYNILNVGEVKSRTAKSWRNFPGTVSSPAFLCWAWVLFRFSTGSRPA